MFIQTVKISPADFACASFQIYNPLCILYKYFTLPFVMYKF